jgi:signal transduction histidine kinase
VVLVLDHLPRLPAAVEVAAFRVAMEATTNAVRHAGAQRVEVALSWADGLRLVVTDDGRGLPAEAAPGVGLRAMAERADELGGWTTTGATATGGTRVVAWLPAEGQP